MEAADAVFGSLLARLKQIVEKKSRSVQAAATRRAALRLLLALSAAAANLHHNILVEYVTLHGLAPAVLAATAADDDSGAADDAAQLLLLLASYRRHESPNAFLSLMHKAGAETPPLPALVGWARRVFSRVMYPSAEGDAAEVGGSWMHSASTWAEWTAHMLTLEAYLPASLNRQVSGAKALKEQATPLTLALMFTYELASVSAGATLVALCEQVRRKRAARAGLATRGSRVLGI